MAYYWFKAFHLVGIVVWFAGLFYLVRLFVYHVEANEQPEPAQTILKQQYQIMEKRLYNLITTPGMAVTVAMAIALVTTEPEVLRDRWLHIKLALVAGLIVYHFYCGWLLKQLAADKITASSQQFRVLNEVPTFLLVAIVLLAVFKNNLPLNAAVGSIGVLVLSTLAIIHLYAKKRLQDRRAKSESPLLQSDLPQEEAS